MLLGLLQLVCSEPLTAQRAPVFALESRPASFAPNLGLWPDNVSFHARAGALDAWLTREGWTLALRAEREFAVALRMSFAAGCEPVVDSEIPALTHVFAGDEPCAWRSSAANATRVRWPNVAPGVAVVMRSEAHGFEYDLVLAPGAEAHALAMRVEGHERLAIAGDGALEIATAAGTLRQSAPIAWELDELGERRPLACSFVLLDESSYTFAAPSRDLALAAVIDPALRWSSYLSGGSAQTIETLAAGPNDTVIVAGHTDAIDFPTTPGAYDPSYHGAVDAFVSCFSNDGTQLLWSTFLGGADDDFARGVAVDANGAVLVAGETRSSNFPTTALAFDTSFGAPRDAFVLRLSPQGDALEWSSFVGGNKADGAYALALDAAGPVLVGSTQGGTFPTTMGAFDRTFNGGAAAGDVFVARVSNDGAQLAWSTFLGGNGNELATRVALAPTGEVAVSGMTFHTAFPASAGAFDTSFDGSEEPFVASFDAQGASLRFASFLGLDGADEIRALAVRANGNVVCGGTTSSPAFPVGATSADAQFAGASEGFVVELDAAGAQLVHGTLWGGSEDDAVTALALEPAGGVLVAGDSSSPDMLTTPGAYSRTLNAQPGAPEYDTFVARLAGDLASAPYATYFGGPRPDHMRAVALAANGEALLAGVTQGASFPTSPTAFLPAWNVLASQEGFVARLAFLLHPIPFGAPKVNSQGFVSHVIWNGFPSASENDFRVGVDFAMPLAWTAIVYSAQTVNWPFQGGRLRCKPPLVRVPRFKTDAFGYGMKQVTLPAATVGQTLYFQAWYQDDGDPYGGALTDALRVVVHP